MKIFKKRKFKDHTLIKKKNLIKNPNVGATPLKESIGIKKKKLNVKKFSVFLKEDILLKSLP